MPKTYGTQFRQDIIDMARTGEAPLATIAKDSGLSPTTLRRWIATAERKESGRHETNLLAVEAARGLLSAAPDAGTREAGLVVWGTADTTEAVHGSGLGEHEVIAAAKAGSVDAMALLYQRHKAQGLGFVLTLVRDEHEAHEILQDAFTSTFQAIATEPGPLEDFRAHLTTAIKRTAIGAWRRSVQDTRTEAGVMDAVHAPVIDNRFTAALHNIIAAEPPEHTRAALATLPPRWQKVLWHTDVLKERPRRIAPQMGLTPNAVSALLLRARKGLRSAHLTAETEAENRDSLPDRHPGT